jgi:DNA-directed RNA polymerase subunit RPC12/RpoP
MQILTKFGIVCKECNSKGIISMISTDYQLLPNGKGINVVYHCYTCNNEERLELNVESRDNMPKDSKEFAKKVGISKNIN